MSNLHLISPINPHLNLLILNNNREHFTFVNIENNNKKVCVYYYYYYIIILQSFWIKPK